MKEGNIPAGILTQAKSLLETGRVVNPSKTILSKREELGLAKIASAGLDEVQKILKMTAFDKKTGLK